MGASNSVAIQLDSPASLPGESVSGAVHLNLAKEIEARSVFLEIKGNESTYWSTGSGKNRRVHRGGSSVLRGRVELMPGGVLQPGQFSIPFSFDLPVALPPTFRFRRNRARARVTYEVRAVIEAAGLLSFNITDEAPLVVLPPPPPAALAVDLAESENVTQCCCFNQGVAQVTLGMSTDTFFEGEAADVTASLTNSSSADVTLAVKFRRHVTLRDNWGTTHREFETLTRAELPAGGGAVRLPLVAPDWPEMPVVRGSVLTCEYVVQAVGVVSMGSDIVCEVPVHVLPPAGAVAPVPQAKLLEAPPGWAPVVAEGVYCPVAIAVGEAVDVSDDEGDDLGKPLL